MLLYMSAIVNIATRHEHECQWQGKARGIFFSSKITFLTKAKQHFVICKRKVHI